MNPIETKQKDNTDTAITNKTSEKEEELMEVISSIPPNIQNLENSYNFFTNLNIGLLILAGLVALAIAIVAVYSNREGNKLKEAQKAELLRKDAALSLQIETAKLTAAEAHRQTSALNLKVEEEARKRAEAELALETLRGKLRSRSLTQKQRDILLQSLRHLSGARIAVGSIGDKEAAEYAEQIVSVLNEAGLVVVRSTFGSISPPQDGIIISPDPSLSVLHDAFKKAQINYKTGQIPGPGQTGIFIGLKPPIDT